MITDQYCKYCSRIMERRPKNIFVCQNCGFRKGRIISWLNMWVEYEKITNPAAIKNEKTKK